VMDMEFTVPGAVELLAGNSRTLAGACG